MCCLKQIKIIEFNDLTIDPEGNVYITEGRNGGLYFISRQEDKLELFFMPDDFVSPNGIAYDKLNNKIYMADWRIGIYCIDPETKEYFILPQPRRSSTYGIDGLYFYNNSLVAVQNGLDRVTRFYLNEDGSKIEKMEILEANNPICDIPTTGAISDGSLYYIANTGRDTNYKNEPIREKDKRDITILKIDLE